jgi:phenylacetic acid degradation operon negative regulatory protein
MKSRIVHEWRKFPRIDPGLPTSLLPHGWPSPRALALFKKLHNKLAPAACAWFEDLERQGDERRARRQRGS